MTGGNEGCAVVKVEGEDSLVRIPVSFRKPDIPPDTKTRWQKLADLVSGAMHVPATLVTRFTEEDLEVFVASCGDGNPCRIGDRAKLGLGMFSETVAGRKSELLVGDAERSAGWAGNPQARLGIRSYVGVPVLWRDGELFGTFCVFHDEPDRLGQEHLELLRRLREILEDDLISAISQEELLSRLEAKELELREIRHRVKNQYTLLISFINLQSRSDSGRNAVSILREIQHRVMALSMINEELYCAAGGGSPGLDVYLRRLCSYILEDFSQEDIEVDYSIESISLAADQETPIALIITELLTNSIKHAFRGDGPKRIGISLRRTSSSELSMRYRDNGVGFPPGFDPKEAKSLGIVLIDALVRQLGGSMRLENEGGAKLSFLFSA